MRDFLLSDKALKVLEKSLDISARRHRMITNNIVNMDTRGFKPRDLDFNKALKEAMKNPAGRLSRTHPKHFTSHSTAALKASIRQGDEEDNTGLDPVNIDTEMTHLIENNLKYRTSVEMLLRKMGMLKHAITEGGR
ncbi:MAG: flagellar basal body rod protein FlgB [Deltaproteobacteria bacterium]|nr:flagellar basal body rod protein FlgB [Deltaproteobacteria bacterium]MBW1960795.1 flagellar basal body rod protein FlgB [Deltaproteobacteria bacterium]MBW2151752.1 flagellar basal body rod protein FlgB [Deltaproteobacteria bacterium]